MLIVTFLNAIGRNGDGGEECSKSPYEIESRRSTRPLHLYITFCVTFSMKWDTVVLSIRVDQNVEEARKS
ncbi:hypothetical protein Y032_0358g3411 [Ancylostoma ceylanicum]|uniref:Uncharacterized protein n=1 Tax=Ancylostoma ceylanicum TaxID=53326 RepID=A0A016RWR3_9BILA|nr:hypothetical protein Y032_0358g3411 [Ancylostoma ceylanicum]